VKRSRRSLAIPPDIGSRVNLEWQNVLGHL